MSVLVVGCLMCTAARAQQAASRVGVVRSTSGAATAELTEAVDAALLRDLADIAGIADPVVSPIDLAEIQLSVGCADAGRACLESIARAAGVAALLVRSLGTDDQGRARVELRYFDTASSDDARAVSAERPVEQSGELAGEVTRLVRELFGIPEVAAAAEPAADPPQPRPQPGLTASSDGQVDRGGSALPWILMGAGAVAVTTGAIVGAIASEDFDTWKARAIRTDAEAEQANDDFDDLQARAIGADVAMVGGAIALGVGVTLLILELGDGEDHQAHDGVTLALEPRPDGGLLRLHGAFREAW